MYVVTNPAWPDMVKVGVTSDYKARLRQYQTGAPNRDYRLEGLVWFSNIAGVERAVHERLARFCGVRGTEWFECGAVHALDAILMEKYRQ